MIDLEFLASKINEDLGTDRFCVYLNTNGAPSEIGDRTVVTMNVLRVPFSFTMEEFDAETLTITLTFDESAEPDERAVTLKAIEDQLLGFKTFLVEQPKAENETEVYIVSARFEQQPTGLPYADFGGITQQIVVSGVAHAQNTKHLSMVGNYVEVYINGEKLLKLTRASSYQVGADSNVPLSEDKTRTELVAISHNTTKEMTFLYTGKEIEREFLLIAEGLVEDINKEYECRIVYGDDFAVTQNVKLVGVSSQDSAGVYLQYTLQMQVTSDTEVE